MDRSALKRIRTGALEIAYEESGPADGAPVFLMHGFPVRPAHLRRRGAAAGRGRLPRHRALPARLRADALPRGRHAALRPAGGARQRSQGAHGRARRRARRAGRLRLGRPRRLRRRRAVAGARARPGLGQRLQHSGHRRLGEAGGAGAGAPASGTSTTSTPSAAAPDWRPTAASSASCCGGCGRRTGGSTMRPSSGRRRPSTIPISSRWSSTPTATASARRRAIRAWRTSSGAWRRSRAFPCRRSCCTATAAALSAPESSVKHAPFFTGRYQHRVIPVAGHNLPQEVPKDFADAVLDLVKGYCVFPIGVDFGLPSVMPGHDDGTNRPYPDSSFVLP